MTSDQLIAEPNVAEAYLKSFRDLIVWQKAMDLVEKVYLATAPFPKEETYGLRSQVRRAAISIPSNIAEGQQRNGRKEFVQFLGIACGSLAEVQTQILLSSRLNLISSTLTEQIIQDTEEISKMLTALIKALTTGH